MKEYKWRLLWSGVKDRSSYRPMVEHCKTYPLFKDSESHIVNYDEYCKLVEAGEIDPPKSYWQIEKGQIGVVSLSAFRRYTSTWESIGSCMIDFEDGWRAAEKYYKKG